MDLELERARAIVDAAIRKIKTPSVIGATVQSFTPATGFTLVHLDGDPPGTAVQAASVMATAPGVGYRVLVLLTPPAGAYVIGATGQFAQWNRPWGYQTLTSWTSDKSSTGGTISDVTNASVTWTATANRRYRSTIMGHFYADALSCTARMTITDGSNAQKGTPGLFDLVDSIVNSATSVCLVGYESGIAAGSVTRKMRIQQVGSAGTTHFFADATRLASWLVEDIGPSGAPA